MICAFLLFCSVVFSNPDVTLYPGAVSFIEPNIIAAHNYLDGEHFTELQVGDFLYYQQDDWGTYRVTEVLTYEAGTNDTRVLEYIHSKDLVLINCIEKDNNPIWGRLIVILEEYGN